MCSQIRQHWMLAVAFFIALWATSAHGVHAQTTVDLHDFNAPSTSWTFPVGAPVLGSDGSLYGVTIGGGASNDGSVYKLTSSGAVAILHSFSGRDGNAPICLVSGTDGNFYGVTSAGGPGYGTIFKITPSGVLSTIHSFTSSFSNLKSIVLGSDGSFYGASNTGGSSNAGLIYKVTSNGAFTTLHTFTGPDGNNPIGTLVSATDGSLYGVTQYGGTDNLGTVFKVTTAGSFTLLHSFVGTDGSLPEFLLQGIDGNFYGCATAAVTSNDEFFEMTPAGVVTITAATFTSSTGGPTAMTVASDGNFYGATYTGGAVNWGQLFKLTPSGTLTTLYSFDGQYSGASAVISTGLSQATDGNIYGTAFDQSGNAEVFELTTTGSYSPLYTFGDADGNGPAGKLTLGPDGNYYGTTKGYGPFENGTVFKITPSGALTTLHYFAPTSDIELPYPGLTLGADGNFYGTTTSQNSNGNGSVFRITPAGVFTTLYRFTGAADGANPDGLALGSNGSLYGTTSTGGTNGDGTVFSVTPAGVLTTLHAFTGRDGESPVTLIEGSDGNFYGTTFEGGGGAVPGDGTIFQMTPGGAVTSLHSFSGFDGQYPLLPLMEGQDGRFYGSAILGGSSNDGTLFSITSGGLFTLLHSFLGTDGSVPIGALVQTANGEFYGTASGGGLSDDGVIFDFSIAGGLNDLFSFSGANGSNCSGIIQGANGNMYGVNYQGGAYSGGNIYELLMPAAAPAGLTATAGNGEVGLSWTAVSGATSYNLYRGTAGGSEASTPIATGITRAIFEDTGLTNGTTYYYTVAAVNAGGTSAPSNEASATPHLAAPPVPGRVVATSGDETASVTWAASAGATSYNVYQSINSGAYGLVKSTSTTSYSASGLTDGSTYSYEIAAVGGNGAASANSAPVSVTPTGVTIKAGPTVTYRGSTATITWSTNLASQSVVNYGTIPSLGSSASNAAMSSYHSITLTGLSLVPTYYDVSSTDGVTTATSGVANFTP